MSDIDREKWNNRYTGGAYADRGHPSDLLARWLPRLRVGRALDIACGAGRNALFLARHGFQVDAVDISRAGLDRGRQNALNEGLRINWIERDLDSGVGRSGPYDLVLLIRYVDTELIRGIAEYLAPGGIFVCEQHLITDADVIGPTNSAFRLRQGELIELLPTLDVLDITEGLVEDPDGRCAALARLVAQRREAI